MMYQYIFNYYRIQTVPDSTNVYAVGDLGFEPDHIELENKSEIEGSYSVSLKSTLQILKELEYLSKIDSVRIIIMNISISSNNT